MHSVESLLCHRRVRPTCALPSAMTLLVASPTLQDMNRPTWIQTTRQRVCGPMTAPSGYANGRWQRIDVSRIQRALRLRLSAVRMMTTLSVFLAIESPHFTQPARRFAVMRLGSRADVTRKVQAMEVTGHSSPKGDSIIAHPPSQALASPQILAWATFPRCCSKGFHPWALWQALLPAWSFHILRRNRQPLQPHRLLA